MLHPDDAAFFVLKREFPPCRALAEMHDPNQEIADHVVPVGAFLGHLDVPLLGPLGLESLGNSGLRASGFGLFAGLGFKLFGPPCVWDGRI